MEIRGRLFFKKYGIAMVLGILFVLALEYIYFFQVPYPKGILAITEEGMQTRETISRVGAYFAATVAQMLFLVWPPSRKGGSWKRFLTTLGVLVFLRIVCDLVQYAGIRYLLWPREDVYIPLEIIYVCGTYLLSYKLLYQEKVGGFFSGGKKFFALSFVVLLVAGMFAAQLVLRDTVVFSESKYQEGMLMDEVMEMVFSYRKQRILLLFSIVNSVFWFLYSAVYIGRLETTLSPKGSVYFIRFMLILCVLMFWSGIQFQISPEGAIVGDSYFYPSGSYSSARNKGFRFFARYSDRIISRVIQGEKKEVYREMGHVVFGQNETDLFSFSIPRGVFQPTEIDVGNFCSFVYGDYAILLIDVEGKLECIESANIKNMPENEKLIKVLEHRIQAGRVEMFEYGYEYLLQHDKEFILPFIERYAENGMTSKELEQNENIRPEYVVSIATEARQKAEEL